MKEKIGISDIASSEGKITDFTIICKIIDSTHGASQKKLFEDYQKVTGSKSYGSFQRKLSIMDKLDLIETMGEKIVIGTYGKVLSKNMIRTDGYLETSDKALFFIILFGSLTRVQLSTLLDVIDKQNGRNKKEIIIEYFRTPISLELWDENKRLNKNVESLIKTGVLPSMLNNKFSCMKNWLETLGLIEIKKERFYTKIPTKLIASLLEASRVGNIYEDASVMYYLGAKKYDNSKHFEILRDLVIKGHDLFCIKGSGISDVQAVSKYACLKLLEMQIILEEKKFFEMTHLLIDKGVIRSIMVGRDGTLKNMTM